MNNKKIDVTHCRLEYIIPFGAIPWLIPKKQKVSNNNIKNVLFNEARENRKDRWYRLIEMKHRGFTAGYFAEEDNWSKYIS